MTLRLESFFRPPPTRVAPSAPGARLSSQVLAGVLDQLAGPGFEPGLGAALQNSSQNLSQAFLALSPAQRAGLRRQWGAATVEELLSLSQERDGRVFEQGLLLMARRLREGDSPGRAAGLLRGVLQIRASRPDAPIPFSAEFVRRAEAELGVIEGHGAIGPRLAFLGEHLVENVTDPVTLAGFAVGSGVFQATRFAVLSRLTASSTAGLLTRGMGAQLMAGIFGVSAEASAMTLSTQGLAWGLGRPVSWDPEALALRTLSLGMTLGLLRGGGFLAERGFNWVHGVDSLSLQATRFSGFTEFTRRAFPQAAMFGAIFVGQELEARVGLRAPFRDPGMRLTESLATLLEFNLGAQLFERMQPREFASWNHALQWQAGQMTRRSPPRRIFPEGDGGMAPLLAGMPAGWRMRAPERAASEEPGIRILQMVKQEGEDGPPAPEAVGAEGGRASMITVKALPFRGILEQAPFPILVTDLEGNVMYANGLAERTFWPTPSDLLHNRLAQLIVSVPGEEGLVRARSAESSDQVLALETHSLPDPEGGFVHYFFDRSQVRGQQQAILRLQEQIAGMEGNREIMEGVMHDSTNAIADLFLKEAAVESLLQRLLPKDRPSGRWGGLLNRVAEIGSSLTRVTKLFRTTQKVMSGRSGFLMMESESFITEALSLNAGARDRQKITLQTEVEPAAFRGEEAGLMYAMLNLFVNASHAMPNGGTLSVRGRTEGEFYVIEISDTGTGIAPEHLDRIFEPHFTTKGPFGTGMGLFMVRRTIEETHGGRVEVQSVVGNGTSFRLFLPLGLGPSSRR